jgi:hypothetical protein
VRNSFVILFPVAVSAAELPVAVNNIAKAATINPRKYPLRSFLHIMIAPFAGMNCATLLSRRPTLA